MLEDMVLKKRQEYGFSGFLAPFVPRAPRSARKGLRKKKVEDSQICAFELLASLAGKLLQESESSSASSNASETIYQRAIGDDVFKTEQDESRLLKTEFLDQGSCEESVFAPPIASSDGNRKCILKKSPQAESYSVPERSSAIANSDSLEKVSGNVKSSICKSKTPGGSFHCKVEDDSPVSVEYKDVYMKNGFNGQLGIDGMEIGGLRTNNTSSLKDSIDLCTKFPESINSDNNFKLQSCRDPVPNASILRLRNNSKLGIRDVDENCSRYNKPGTKPRVYRHPSRLGERRLRKLLTSKHWKVAPKLKDCDIFKAGYLEGGAKPFYCKRKICYGREKYQRDSLYKRRKFSGHSLVVASDGGFSSESVCNSPEKGVNVDKKCSENGASSSIIGHQQSAHSKDSRVKFSIKSFRIPELFIQVPENATVGCLKRTVMETVTAVLGGGLRVGVVLHGKKVRDDNRTLSQTGITSEENLDTLGFTLEPCTVQVPPSVSTEDPPVPLSCDTSQLALRSAAAPVLNPGISDAFPDPPPLTTSANNDDSINELLSSPIDKLTDKTMSDSRALVAIPPASASALAVIPVNQKPRRSELVQRRTRRPFSVTEVEALVEAVEELGTGRWRDVKLRSFENADHRTYVDLKDKWKTLVHTAKIAPQQRRGEPVPQELLDRVLSAHAYWSQHQAKQHSKNQTAVLKITAAHGCGRTELREGIHLI